MASLSYKLAYLEAIRVWLKYKNYKGDKRKRIYLLLQERADSARDFLWNIKEFPNFLKISKLYEDEDITTYEDMVKRIFGKLEGTTEHDNAYYRARIQSLRDYAANVRGENRRFFQNGFVPAFEQGGFDNYVENRIAEQSNDPLSFIELTTYNTWYEQHPEKVAGTMVEGSSLYFPVVVRGNKLDVMAMFKAALKEQAQTIAEPQQKPQEDEPQYKVGDKFVNNRDKTIHTIIKIVSIDELDGYLKAVLERHNAKHLYYFDNNTAFWTAKIKEFFTPVSSDDNDDELELLELEAEALEMELKLDGGLGRISNKAKKRVLETVSVAKNGQHHQAVVSSTNGANILKGLDNLAEKLEKFNRGPVKTFLGDVAKTIGSERKGSKSEYATFETINGKVVTIRLADHNATVSTFDNHNEEDGISIVVTSNDNKGINNDGKAHVVEFYYNAIKLRRADGKPLAKIVRSIKQSLYSGEFKDTTGLAEKQEVNIQKR